MVRKLKSAKKKKKKVSSEHIEFSKIFGKMKKDSNVKECLWGEECSEKIINAHSIQENGLLTEISEDGDVYTFNQQVENGWLNFNFDEQGKKSFSTFTGFCGKHDKELFQPIEDNEFIASNEQFFLFAFKSISREYHAKKESFNMSKLQLKMIDEDKRKGVFNPAELFIRNNYRNNQIDCEAFKKMFLIMKKGIKTKNYDDLITKYIKFEKKYPIVANSCFIPYRGLNNEMIFSNEFYSLIQKGEKNPFVTLNIFPKNGETHILISYFKEYENELKHYFEGEITKENLSNILVYYVENMAFSPSYIKEKFSQNEIEIIQNEFQANITNPLLKHKRVPNLFREYLEQ